MTAQPETLYGAADLTHLEGLDAVRKRPGMYIGSTDSRGVNHLFNEIVDNSTDEGVAGFATRVKVTLHEDGSVQVDDDGRGHSSNGTAGSGNGIPGMRERAAALGGRLDAGPRPGGGFRVRATLPLGSNG